MIHHEYKSKHDKIRNPQIRQTSSKILLIDALFLQVTETRKLESKILVSNKRLAEY